MSKTKEKPRLRLKGIVPAIFTPYNKRGDISYPVLAKSVDYLVGAGVHGFYVCGTTGEGVLLSAEERMKVLEHVLARVPKKLPIIAQVGALSTREACRLAKHAGEAGATQATRYAIVLTSRVVYSKVGETVPIWQNSNFQVRDEYDLGDDPQEFLDREDQAIERLASSYASSLVATMLEAF